MIPLPLIVGEGGPPSYLSGRRGEPETGRILLSTIRPSIIICLPWPKSRLARGWREGVDRCVPEKFRRGGKGREQAEGQTYGLVSDIYDESETLAEGDASPRADLQKSQGKSGWAGENLQRGRGRQGRKECPPSRSRSKQGEDLKELSPRSIISGNPVGNGQAFRLEQGKKMIKGAIREKKGPNIDDSGKGTILVSTGAGPKSEKKEGGKPTRCSACRRTVKREGRSGGFSFEASCKRRIEARDGPLKGKERGVHQQLGGKGGGASPGGRIGLPAPYEGKKIILGKKAIDDERKRAKCFL